MRAVERRHAGEAETGRACPYCRFPLKQGVEVVQCAHCNSAHHADCWDDNGGCAIVACEGGPAKQQQPELQTEDAPKLPEGPAHQPTRRRALVTVLVALTVVAGIAAFLVTRGEDEGSTEPKLSQELEAGSVASVSGVQVTRSDFDHWLDAAAQGSTPPNGAPAVVPDPDREPRQYNSLKKQVMQFLISAEWIQQEADARGIEATEDEIEAQFERQKDESFSSEAEFEEFLRTSGQSEQDLLFRVELDVLSNKVRKQVIADAPAAQRKQRALDDFVEDFRERYRAATWCATEFITRDCANSSS